MLFGRDCFGRVPFGRSDFAAADIVDHAAMLAEPRTRLVYTATIKARPISSDDVADDFGHHDIGSGLPSGFTARWTTTNITYAIQAEAIAGSISGQELKTDMSVSTRRAISLDAAGQVADVEILARGYAVGVSAGSGFQFGVGLRVGGSAGSEDGYMLNLRTSGGATTLAGIQLTLAGVLSTPGSLSYSWSTGTRYWFRFRVVGSALKGKIWPAGTSEPAAWSVEITDTSIAAAGYAALIASTPESKATFDFIAVLAGGDTVPLPEDETLTIATSWWAPPTGGILESVPFRGVMESYNFRRSINNGGRFGGLASGEGTITFANSDGYYDAAIDGYAIDGREVVVRVGRQDDILDDHLVICTGVAVDWSATETEVTLTIKDKSDKLNVPAQPNVYAGTGGKEGGSDLAGKRKPIALGGCLGVTPTLVDETLLIYQVGQDRAAAGSVFDRGVALTRVDNHGDYSALAAATIAAGEFDTCFSEGLFRLGAAPAGFLFSTVSFTQLDVHSTDSDLPSANSDHTTPAVVEWIIENSSSVARSDINWPSFSLAQDHERLDSGSLKLITYYISSQDSLTVAEAIGNLMHLAGGWCGFNRDGELSLGFLDGPTGTPVDYFDVENGGVVALARDTMPSGVWPPPWRWRVAEQRRWTELSDFAAATASAVVSLYSQPYNLADADDQSILADHANALDPSPVEAYYDDTASNLGFLEAKRLLSLYGSGYRLYRVTVPRAGLLREIGDEVNITYPRFRLDAGRNAIIVTIDDKVDLRDGGDVEQVELTVFG